MNIVILAGGTGSIALQTGLYDLLDRNADGVDTKVLINGYDNGLSTGAVRRVFGGSILGPSDLRKNQTTRLKLENPDSPWIKFLDVRFTCETKKAKMFCLDQVKNLASKIGENHNKLHTQLLEEAVSVFFSSPVAEKIDYNDFALANIIYAGFARANNNSLREAGRIMSSMMGIKDNVILNDDTSLFLGAVTKSGVRVTDEGDIVNWGKQDDPFVDVFFTDASGNDAVPQLCLEAEKSLVEADYIIASSGTQWASLIPTYASRGFKEAMERTSAKIVMVMNRVPDKDSPGQTASEIVKAIIPRYFPENRVHLVLDSKGHYDMSKVDSEATALLASVNTFDMGPASQKSGDRFVPTHCPLSLSFAIGRTVFKDYLNSDHFMFDYDDTLVGRGNNQLKASKTNRNLICRNVQKVSICTGNSANAVTLLPNAWGITIYADGGVNEYQYDAIGYYDSDADSHKKVKFVKCLDDSATISRSGEYSADNIIKMLKLHGIPHAKIENRGNAIISIKPIEPEYRPAVCSLIKLLLKNSGLKVVEAGRTTIDIMSPNVSKVTAVKHALSCGVKTLTFIGDELSDGNDAPVAQMNDPRVRCLHIKDPAMTAFFLLTLNEMTFKVDHA